MGTSTASVTGKEFVLVGEPLPGPVTGPHANDPNGLNVGSSTSTSTSTSTLAQMSIDYDDDAEEGLGML